MTTQNNNLKKLVEIGKNPIPAARERAKGRRAVGHTLTDAPVEMLHAAGLYPVAILGHRGQAGKGRDHFQSFACSYGRGVIDMFEANELDFLEGVIVTFICDTTRSVDILLRYKKPTPYVESYRPPKSLTGPGARNYLVGELDRLKKSVEKFAGVVVSDDKLKASIKLYNRARKELKRLAPMRESDPTSFYGVCRAYMTIPVEEFLEDVAEIETPKPADTAGFTRLLIAGKVGEPGDLVQVIYDLGARIVGDDFATAERLFAKNVDENAAPLEALADRQINNIPFAGLIQGPEDRTTYLARIAKETKAAGVIISVQKFCEIFEIDAPEVREHLKRQNLPVLVIETDYEPAVSGSLRTRIEAFLEVIRHG